VCAVDRQARAGPGELLPRVLAQGIEDYYTGAGEAPGRWLGSAARELGMGGEVEDDDLHAVLNGSSPRTGEPLAAAHGGTRIPGFYLTFSAPQERERRVRPRRR
jgi:conjugative relaxase-like TrwC/TraI family protein